MLELHDGRTRPSTRLRDRGSSRRIRIPAGTQPGKVLRVRGEGAPHSRKDGTGDLLVTVRVVVPHHLNREQKRLVSELAKHDDLRDRDALFGTTRGTGDDPVAAEA